MRLISIKSKYQLQQSNSANPGSILGADIFFASILIFFYYYSYSIAMRYIYAFNVSVVCSE